MHLANFDLNQIKLALLGGLSKQTRTLLFYNQVLNCLISEIYKDRDETFWGAVVTELRGGDRLSAATEDNPDTRKVMTVLWGLISDGVLYPRFLTKNTISTPIDSLYGITEYGRRVIDSLGSHPGSPGFISHIRGKAPRMTDDVVACLEDASECLRRGLLRAATVMIGLACEITIRVALEGLHFIGGPEAKSKAIVKIVQLRTAISSLPSGEEKHRLEVALPAFETIRVARNEAAHPSGVTFDHSNVESLLIMAANQISVVWQNLIEKAIVAGFVPDPD